jgi:hypothetical protein
MTQYNWEAVREALTKGSALITFKKANGALRVLECTLVDYILPEVVNPSTLDQKQESMTVFDLESNHWRSFRFDTVTDVEFL